MKLDAPRRFQRYRTPPDVPPRERFDFWRGWHCEALDTAMRLEPVTADPPENFSSSAEVLTVGAVDIVELRSGASIGIWRREGMEASDRVRIALFDRAPGVVGHWHGHDCRLSDGRPVLFGRTAGRWRAPAGFHSIQVNVPRTALPVSDAWVDRIAEEQRVMSSSVWVCLVRPMLLGMIGRLGPLSKTADEELAAAWLSLVTLLLRSVGATGPAESAESAELAPAHRLAVRRFIDSHLADPDLGPDMIAAALHLSRRALYRLLTRDGGEGVATVIRRRRLARAHQLLTDPNQRHRPVADIAASVGMGGPAQFSRAFRAEYGRTPRELRHRARSPDDPAPVAGTAPPI